MNYDLVSADHFRSKTVPLLVFIHGLLLLPLCEGLCSLFCVVSFLVLQSSC